MTHEHDCQIVCVGCDKTFCEIKNECNLPHDEELPETFMTNSGNHFCHVDCFHDGQ